LMNSRIILYQMANAQIFSEIDNINYIYRYSRTGVGYLPLVLYFILFDAVSISLIGINGTYTLIELL